MQRNRGYLLKIKGNYGFIRCNGKDVFVHFSNYLHGFVPELNQFVEFDFGPSPREDRPATAIRVRVIKNAAQVAEEFNRKQAGASTLKAGVA
jgi:cold shock CspA family protein